MTNQARAISSIVPADAMRVPGPAVFVIRGGKGGVGATQIAANVAVALSGGYEDRPANRVLLVDGGRGVGNATFVLGINEPYDLRHAITGEKSVEEIIYAGPCGIGVLAALDGVEDGAAAAVWQRERLRRGLASAAASRDFVLIDTPSGLLPGWCGPAAAATAVIVVTTPDAASLAGAYATIKELFRADSRAAVWLVVNMAASRLEAARAFSAVAGVAQRFLGAAVRYLGWVPAEVCVLQASRRRVPFVREYAGYSAARAVEAIAQKLMQARSGQFSAVPSAVGVENRNTIGRRAARAGL